MQGTTRIKVSQCLHRNYVFLEITGSGISNIKVINNPAKTPILEEIDEKLS